VSSPGRSCARGRALFLHAWARVGGLQAAVRPRRRTHPRTAAMPSSSDFELTPQEAGALFWRNVVLLLLSLLAGGRTLYLIGLAQFGAGSGGGGRGRSVTWSGGGAVGGHHHPHPPTVRSFANSLMGVLLLAEMLASVSWLVGVCIAGGADGSAPWSIALDAAEKICVPVRCWGLEVRGGGGFMAYIDCRFSLGSDDLCYAP
jgi:hypothetical protein